MQNLDFYVKMVREATGINSVNIIPVRNGDFYLITILDKINKVSQIFNSEEMICLEVFYNSSNDTYLEHSVKYAGIFQDEDKKVYFNKTGIIIDSRILAEEYDNSNRGDKAKDIIRHIMMMQCTYLFKGGLIKFDEHFPMKILDRYQDYQNKADVLVLGNMRGHFEGEIRLPWFDNGQRIY